MKLFIVICIILVFFLFCIYIGFGIFLSDDGILSEYDKKHLTKKQQEEKILRYQDEVNYTLMKHTKEKEDREKLTKLVEEHKDEIVDILSKDKDSRV